MGFTPKNSFGQPGTKSGNGLIGITLAVGFGFVGGAVLAIVIMNNQRKMEAMKKNQKDMS